MPQSLSSILLHIVFSTKDRQTWLDDTIRSRIFAYLAEVGRDMGCEVYRVGGMPDHVHFAVRLARTVTVADLVKKLKSTSSVWIKEHGSDHKRFSWQTGYGVFSLGASQLPDLIRYIERQEEHHKIHCFQDEFRQFLQKYGISFDERYLWD
jgi:REP element-mobilizing transposase RayT